jgi:protein-tyrosine phosphatase
LIDLHNHILPGIDDGAVDSEESTRMARQFVQEGVIRIAATPHVDALRGSGPTARDVEQKVDSLNNLLSTEGIDLAVEPGCELYLTPDAPTWLQTGKAAPLGNGRAVLVECSFQDRPLYLEDTLFQLQIAGYRPILAHPERYAFVQRDGSVLDHLIQRDVILQLTAPALLGEYGGRTRRVAQHLLQRGMYALAASDRHHSGPLRSLAELYDRIARHTDADMADLLLRSNPSAALSGSPVVQPDVSSAERSSFFARLLHPS